jgi:quercetin dioxygenase-like cupin family protein
MENPLVEPTYTHFSELAKVAETPADGILSRTLLDTPTVKVVLFAFSAGQELSEHTASMAAIVEFVRGDAEITLGEDKYAATSGFWVYMPPNLKHSIRTKTPTVMLLTLLKRTQGDCFIGTT